MKFVTVCLSVCCMLYFFWLFLLVVDNLRLCFFLVSFCLYIWALECLPDIK